MFSLIGSALKGFAFLVVFVLATVGLAAVAVKVSEYYGTRWWSREQLEALSGYGRLAWSEGKNALETLTWALAAFGLVAALGRLKTIARLISDFRDSKGSIFELSTTITGVKDTVTAVKTSASALEVQVARLSDLAPVVTSTAEKLEDVLKQLADLQRIAVSEQGAGEGVVGSVSSKGEDEDEKLDENWEQLRSYWFANGERLDAVIENIPQARLRSRIRRIPKTDYRKIINALAHEGKISEAARKLSLELHKEFLSHRSRQKPVTESIVGAAQVRDAILAKELDSQPEPRAATLPPADEVRKTEAVPVV